MRLKFQLFLVIFSLILFTNLAQSQVERNPKVQQVQPIIMVIPYAKQNEDLRTVLENNVELRTALAKVKEGFDDRGFTTVDFVAKLKAAELDEVFTSTSQSDVKSTLVAFSGADIYVEVEAYKNISSSGNSARVTISAYDAYTARSMGTKTSSSHTMDTEMFDKLVEQALKRKERGSEIAMVEDFLNVMQEKFTEMIENGRAVKIMFMLDGNAEYDFNSENDDGDLLLEIIEDWMADNSYKNNYNLQGLLGNRLTFSEVRIPLRDERNRNYTPSKFGRAIRKNFRNKEIDGIEINAKTEYRGGTIYITFE